MMRGLRWIAVAMLVLVVAGCGSGGRQNFSSYNGHIVIEEAYFDQGRLIVVTKNIGPRGVGNVKGWLTYLDADGKQLGWSQDPPVPPSSEDYPSHWIAGKTHQETYHVIPAELHSIKVYLYWENFSGDRGYYDKTVEIPYRRQ